MLVITKESQYVETSGGSSAMTADASKMAKLYFMISSTLYTDKPLSIIRELSSNCRDAHEEAGTQNIAFAITAPSRESPTLVVSDAGTGLTYEEAKRTVLMFLGSTKDEGDKADDYVGGWGIGAKSPRAYTSDYQIHTRKNGLEWIVQVFNDEYGMPQELLMLERKTSRPNGLDFHVPIKPIDVTSWREKIKEYMQKTNYNVIAYMGEGEVIKPSPAFRSFDYGDFKLDLYGAVESTKRSSNPSTVKVTYGGMQYDIPASFGLSNEVYALYKHLSYGLEVRIRVDKPNLIKFGLSREHLEVEDGTVSFLTNAVMRVKQDLEVASGADGGKPRPANSYMATWEEIKAFSKVVEDWVKDSESKRLSQVSRKASVEVYWSPGCVQQGRYGRGGGSLCYMPNLRVTLPLQVGEAPVLYVLYSDKNPMQSDWYTASGDKKVVYPSKTDNEDDVRAWAEDLVAIKGLELRYRKVVSTRAKRISYGKRSSGAATLTCKFRGKRYSCDPDQTYVAVGSEKDFWIEAVGKGVIAFVPTPALLKRGMPEEDNVWTLEDWLEDEDTVDHMEYTFLGATVSDEKFQALLACGKFMPHIRDAYPKAVKHDIEKIDATVSRAVGQIQRAKRMTAHIKESYPDFTVVDAPLEGIDDTLKEVNRLVVLLNLKKDLFKVVDFPTLADQLKAGNPEAMRLVYAMRLEEFV